MPRVCEGKKKTPDKMPGAVRGESIFYGNSFIKAFLFSMSSRKLQFFFVAT